MCNVVIFRDFFFFNSVVVAAIFKIDRDLIYIFRSCVSDFSLYTLFVMTELWTKHGTNVSCDNTNEEIPGRSRETGLALAAILSPDNRKTI